MQACNVIKTTTTSTGYENFTAGVSAWHASRSQTQTKPEGDFFGWSHHV